MTSKRGEADSVELIEQHICRDGQTVLVVFMAPPTPPPLSKIPEGKVNNDT
jgi:hypothetical protein